MRMIRKIAPLRLRCVCLLAAALFCSPAFALSEVPIAGKWVTDGTVNALVPTSETLFIGGDFSYVGPLTGGGVPLDQITGNALSTYPRVEGIVHAVAADGAGGWFIGGGFSIVGGQPRQNLAHILPDGTLDPIWKPAANDVVNALVLSGSSLYFGGRFTAVAGQSRDRLAAVDAATGVLSDWNPDASGTVNAVAVSGPNVFVGGEFLSIGGQSRAHLASVNGVSGSINDWQTTIAYQVAALLVDGPRLYVAGALNDASEPEQPAAAALDVNSAEMVWKSAEGAYGKALLLNGSLLYVGAEGGWLFAFDTASGAQIGDLPHGFNDDFEPWWGAEIYTLACSGSTLYIGGKFTRAVTPANVSIPRTNLFAIDLATNSVLDWNPGSSEAVHAFASSGATLYCGGEFASIAGEPRASIAAIDRITGRPSAWNPGVNGVVNTMLLRDDLLYLGGQFSMAGGAYRGSLAALDVHTGETTSWDPDASLWVSDIAAVGSTLYVVGALYGLGSVHRDGAGAVDINTGAILSWAPRFLDPRGMTVAATPQRVFMGGRFAQVNDQPIENFAAFDPTSGSLLAEYPVVDGPVSDFAIAGTTLYMAGSFTMVGRVARSALAAIDTQTGTLLPWDPNALALTGAPAMLKSIAVGEDGLIYVAGDMALIGNEPCNALAAIDPLTGIARPWHPQALAPYPLVPWHAQTMNPFPLFPWNHGLYAGHYFYFPPQGNAASPAWSLYR